jgi:hypothetical protein
MAITAQRYFFNAKVNGRKEISANFLAEAVIGLQKPKHSGMPHPPRKIQSD